MIEMENIKVEWRDDMKRVTGKILVPLFCEQGHEEVGIADDLELMFRNGLTHRFGFISSDSWDFCEECAVELRTNKARRSERSVANATNMIADLFKNIPDPDQQNLHQPVNRRVNA